jgi:mono/diheme cytochrome c family protein
MRALHKMLLGLLAGALTTGATFAATVENGEKVFQNNCAACHQAQAQGTPGLAPPLKSGQWNKFVAARNYVPGVLLAGMNGALPIESGNFVGIMPPQNRLSDEDIASVANYLFIGVNGQANWQPLSAEDVAAMRQNTPAVSSLKALRKQALSQ